MIYTVNNCIRAFGYTNFDKLIADMGSVDGLKEYVRANGYADIAVAEDTELLLVDVNGKTWHTGCYGAKLEPEPGPGPEPARDYLCYTISCPDSSTISYAQSTSLTNTKNLYYKINDGEWLSLYEGNEININNNDKVYLKSDDEVPMCDINGSRYITFGNEITRVDISGNIMSLMNFSDTLPEYCFYNMFASNSVLTDASKLILPNIVSNSCYEGMFYNCTSLVHAPSLPATTLATSCYKSMFRRCTSLTQVHELPATALANSCYRQMFSECTSLTTTLELPATTLADYCYYEMFKQCTSLTVAPALPATTLAPYCYSSMFKVCASLTTAPELPATILTEYCYFYMFNGCTKLNYVKAMCTDISAKISLSGWLEGVSATGTFVKNAAATWTNEQAGIPTGWTVQVEGGVTPGPEPEPDYLCFTSTGDSTVTMTQTGTPNTSANKVIQYKLNDGQWQTWDLSAVSLSDGDKMYLKSDDEIPMSEEDSINKKFVMIGSIAASGNIMSLLNFSTTFTNNAFTSLFEDCTALTSAPELPVTSLTAGCYGGMFRGCTSLTTAPALPATTLIENCYSNMFNFCSSLVQAPELPATTLASYCYYYMFANCSKLNYVKAMLTDISYSGYLEGWLTGVSTTGTFVKNAAATWTNEQAGIPTGWTVQTASPDK